MICVLCEYNIGKKNCIEEKKISKVLQCVKLEKKNRINFNKFILFY